MHPSRESSKRHATAGGHCAAGKSHAAVARLSDDHATVLRLVHIDEPTLVDAGARMRRSGEAARKLYGRALAAMAKQLRDSPGP